MIEIRYQNTSLDIAPDAEFELVLENPLLNDERIPSQFSTDISFPLTPTNRKVFGCYLESMMVPPTVRSLEVELLLSGIPFMTGTIKYNGLDENGLLYNFCSRDFSDILEKKIYELSGLTGEYPILLNSSKTAVSIYDRTNLYSPSVKYHNWENEETPAVSISSILKRAFGRLLDLESIPADEVYIIGLYKNESGDTSVAESLPDRTVSEILDGVLKMFCAFVFFDGFSLTVRRFNEIDQDEEYLDWNMKVSDIYTSTIEEVKGYSLGYEAGKVNEDKSKITDTDSVLPTNMKDLLNNSAINTFSYTALEASDIFSVKAVVGYDEHYEEDVDDYLTDMVYHNVAKYETKAGDSVYDCNIGFSLVASVPVIRFTAVYDGQRTHFYSERRMAPIVTPGILGDERGSEVMVGAIVSGQMTHSGWVGTIGSENMENHGSAALRPVDLCYRFHQGFVRWIKNGRDVVSVDLNLTAGELSAFRFWKKVIVNSRPFFVKTLNIRIQARGGIVSSSADLISC